ncbi:concanavalin A-like lectin/glucanase domain-containing protein [Paraphoma chrysanthemicola]|uniref:endo-1,3(4)-beta-glucanase n=1 Tax=Paraphoma chrysanthemicola TaxID=798071 RepID=A0A8K0W3Y6_9PLEO|nr:concanavalin A-like lectin/glucanase domain-containing protein [Paraphoma chrysanthemicola]
MATNIVLFAHNASHDSGAYTLTDDLSYDNFFDNFDFFSGPDPTRGFVQYHNASSAIEQGLVGYLEDTKSVFMGVDYTNKDPKGRASVRLESKKNFNHGLLVADIRHMPPSQCGLWLACWLLGAESWPAGGEVDLVEGVNDYEHNAVTLHTSNGCVVDNVTSLIPGSAQADDFDAPFTGTLTTADCDVAAANQDKNVGCSIKAPSSLSQVQIGRGSSQDQTSLPSYGTEFNKAGGGIYAMEWTTTSISVWFFPRTSPLYTSTANSTTPDPKQWGTPLAHFAGSGCDLAARFRDLRIIFNTAFCGEWAGKEWDRSCAEKTGVDTCDAYVRDHPEVFKEAYWEVSGLKWFQRQAPAKREMEGGAFVKAKGRFYRV